MDLKFITSDCNCSDPKEKFHPIPGNSRYYSPTFDTDEIQAFLHFKSAQTQTFHSCHLNNKHINNISVNGQSIKRIGALK